MTTENYDFASNIDMAKAMGNIDFISKQIAEKEDAVICKAFTISIARLLKENGIIPIMTEHERMLEAEERFILKSTYGVCFNYLDTSEHDAKVRADAIEEFRAECESASYIPVGYGYYVTDMKDIRKIAEELKEKNNA